MKHHPFLFTPITWLGQGQISLSMAQEELTFFTRWTVNHVDTDGKITCAQEIQIKGLSDIMHNDFLLFDLKEGSFTIDLENEALGRVTGKGLIDEKMIAWEFRVEDLGFDGFEIYEKQDDKNYNLRAEYATGDQFRTLIKGKLWQKNLSSS